MNGHGYFYNYSINESTFVCISIRPAHHDSNIYQSNCFYIWAEKPPEITTDKGFNCQFPFIHKGAKQFTCVLESNKRYWCAVEVDNDEKPKKVDYCQPFWCKSIKSIIVFTIQISCIMNS